MECPTCSAINPAGKRFCGDCGSPLAPRYGDPRGAAEQRRSLTVLFCDLVGFTELSRRTDPEDLAEILGGFQRICARAVKACDGHIAQFLGDGVLIYFGFPRAHEDDARRALDCGLAILAQLGSADAPPGSRTPRVRIGAHTGRVYISALRAGGHREVLALGDVPNVAARITEEAEPDSLWISEATWRLVAGWFEGSEQGKRRVRGVDEKIRLWRVTRRTAAISHLDAVQVRTPYVGRQFELAELRESWNRVRTERHPLLLTLLAEPGMGKSRLIERFLQPDSPADAPRALQLRCLEPLSATPFHPLVELISAYLGEGDDARVVDVAARVRKLEARCASLGLHDPDAAPLLAELAGLEKQADVHAPATSPSRRYRRTVELLARVVDAIARVEGPLLLVIEDLHWADASTLNWIQHLVDTVDDTPLMLLCSGRSGFVPPWRDAARARELPLGRLGVGESIEMVRGVAHGKALPPALMHALVTRFDGVPLYLEEATKSLLASGFLHEGEFAWEAASEASVDEIPSSIEAALAARFDGLGAARTTLDLAATIGREVSVPLLEFVSRDSPAAVASHLEAAIAAGLVEPVQGKAGSARIAFKHALIRDAVYEAIPRRHRTALHARVVAALRSHFPHWAESQPELFALHLTGAGETGSAVEFLRAAAGHALGAGALDEAAAHLEHAVRLLRALPSDDEALRTELAIQLLLGGIYNARTWTLNAMDATWDRVLELSRQLGDTYARHVAYWGKWAVWWARGRIPESIASAARMRDALADENGAPFLPLAATYASALTALEAGDIGGALTHSNTPLGADVVAVDAFVAANIQVSPWTGTLVTRYCCHYIRGHFSEAERTWQQIERMGTELAPTPIAQGFATSFGLSMRFACGSLPDWAEREPAQLDRQLVSLIRLCHDEGLGMWLSFAVIVQSALECHRQRLPGLRQRVAEQIRLLDAAGIRLFFVHFLALYAWLCHLDGDSAKAMSLLDDARAEARRSGQHLGTWDVHRLRARILCDCGYRREAVVSLADASEAAARLGSPTFLLRCALDRYALACTSGSDDDALAALWRAYKAMPEPDADVPDLQRARIALAIAPGPGPAARDGPHPGPIGPQVPSGHGPG